MSAGDRVSWDIPGFGAGTGTVIGATNTHDVVRSDEVVAVHRRQPPGTGTWTEHRLLHISPGHLTVVPS